MDSIKELSKALPRPFMWAKDDDKWNEIQAVVKAYVQFTPTIGQSKSQALYTTIKDAKYKQPGESAPALLPRQIAADVVELALYQIIRIPTQPLKVLGEK
jgi:hypothetical protein